MKVSIVVPAFNEEKLIAASLTEIKRASAIFEERGWNTELIVCDNNSTDQTAALARHAGAMVVFEPLNQIGRARNRGAQAATGDWLVFVDADSHPSCELFADVAEQISSGTCLAGGATVRLDEDHRIGQTLTNGWNLISRIMRWAAGSFIYCDAQAFRLVGGFSQDLYASEELDLSKRLKQAARAAGKRFVILHRHPILTSARKMHLYSRKEHLRFFAKAVFRPRRTVRSREALAVWYDGRR